MSEKVLIFGKNTWPYTNAAREAFKQEGKTVEYHDVVSNANKLDTMLKHSDGVRKVPVIVEGEDVTIGFNGTWGVWIIRLEAESWMLDPGYLMLDTELHCRSLSWRAGFKVEGQIFGQLARTSNPVAYTLCLGLSISPWCAGAFHIKYLNKLPAITPWKIDIIAFLVDFPLLIPYIPDLIYR